MTSKSEKFRELIEEETTLRNQLSDCETAQSKMLRKAFRRLGMKIGHFGDTVSDKSYIKIIEITDYSVGYCRFTGGQSVIYEITLEDLFDEEVQE